MESEKGDDDEPPAQAVFGLKDSDETVSRSGHRAKGQSPYGVHDLAGNLYEWTRDWYDEQFYATNPTVNLRGPTEGATKVQWGGSYTNTPSDSARSSAPKAIQLNTNRTSAFAALKMCHFCRSCIAGVVEPPSF